MNIQKFIPEDIVVFQNCISRYEIFKILAADDEEIRLATEVEVNIYYQKWNQ